MNRDVVILFSTRIVRLFCYGFLSVVLAIYLARIGLKERDIGLLFTLTLAGDAGISLWLTTSADRFGRRRTLVVGALLMFGAGAVFLLTRNVIVLMAAAVVGVVSPSGNEIGPFLSVEQAALSRLLPDERRTEVFAWYNLAGSLSTATGALSGGMMVRWLQSGGMPALDAYRAVLAGYGLGGIVLLVLFLALSRFIEAEAVERTGTVRRVLGLHRSRNVIFRLAALFALDAFAGGLIVQAMLAYWFHARFGIDAGLIGSIFFLANLFAGISALLAAAIARRIGLINTMVFTHIPSNVLLILVPLMPTLRSAIVVLLARFCISQMDVPTRQSYTVAVVSPDERSAASGVTGIARSVGAAISPLLTGIFFSVPALVSVPFYLAGGLKIVYDLLLYRGFRETQPPEEKGSASPAIRETATSGNSPGGHIPETADCVEDNNDGNGGSRIRAHNPANPTRDTQGRRNNTTDTDNIKVRRCSG